MPTTKPPLRVSLQAKVLMTVLALLVLLPAAMLWVVDRQITRQTHDDASRALATAQAVFLQSLGNRNDGLVSRYRNIVSDSRFLYILRLKDRATLQQYLKDLPDEFSDSTEVVTFVSQEGTAYSGVRPGSTLSLEEFTHATEPTVRTALAGESSATTYCLQGGLMTVVALPANLLERGGIAGALVVGSRVDDATLQRWKPPQTELALVANGAVVLSTLKGPGTDATLLTLATEPAAGVNEAVLNNEHFLALQGQYGIAGPRQGFRFVMLSSYEQQLTTLRQTRFTLLGLSLAGIAIGALVVWIFVRRITAPLRTLRDSAEAVGRGDFSRRIEEFSNDECGEVAVAFNQMTTNLQTSRTELERAMQTVKATQEQLIQSEKLSAVGQFVAGVAHELNNPLTAVIGFSELLQATEADEKIRGHLDRIAKSAHRCHKIVHSLLSFARQEAPVRKLVELPTIIDEVLEIMAYDLRTSNVTVVKEYAPSLPPIMADPHQLQQVFVNILGNARQAIEPFQREGRIVVRTHVIDGWVTVEFQDNGPGIRPENLARIFDPFFTTKPAGKGTGLGLSLSYGLIQEHGGQISARSELGQGATFIIELPVAADATATPARRSGTPWPGPQPVGKTGKAVLVIDDEAWILDLASELLRLEGHDVAVASSGEQALELLGQRKFDVIVSDWKMPGLSGIRLFEHLQATNPTMAKRMFFMTGDVVSDTFQSFLQQNQLACLSKPFAISEFRSAIARMFRTVK